MCAHNRIIPAQWGMSLHMAHAQVLQRDSAIGKATQKKEVYSLLRPFHMG